MKLKCQCCGFEAEFQDGEAAFEAGWDCPPHFSGYICCPLCPAVCIVLRKSHKLAHEHWAKHGRPDGFGPLCFDDEVFNSKEQEKKLEEFRADFNKVLGK